MKNNPITTIPPMATLFPVNTFPNFFKELREKGMERAHFSTFYDDRKHHNVIESQIGRVYEHQNEVHILSYVDFNNSDEFYQEIKKLKKENYVSIRDVDFIFREHIGKKDSILSFVKEKQERAWSLNFFPVLDDSSQEMKLIRIKHVPEDHYADRNSGAGANDMWFTTPAYWQGDIGRINQKPGLLSTEREFLGINWNGCKGRLFYKIPN